MFSIMPSGLCMTLSLLFPQRHIVPQLGRLFCTVGSSGGSTRHVQGVRAVLDENGALESHFLVHVRKPAPALRHRHVLATADDGGPVGEFEVGHVYLGNIWFYVMVFAIHCEW